jgi:hypothetical protein
VGSANFAKREREKQRQERAARKRERRAARADDEASDDVSDQAELMERFRVLSESLAAGTVTRDDYENERREIFELLGVAGAFDD